MIHIYYAQIDENDENMGLSCISLVTDPAVQSKFLHFSEEEPKHMIFAADEDHHTISGVALRADFPIYRIDEDGNPYYIVFEAATIEKMVKQYAAKGMFNNVSLQHNGRNITGVDLYESFIINRKRGIDPEEFKDIENGSWICSFHITDEELWNEIINGNSLQGFSVECMIGLSKKKLLPVTKKIEDNKENNFQNAQDDSWDTFINDLIKQ